MVLTWRGTITKTNICYTWMQQRQFRCYFCTWSSWGSICDLVIMAFDLSSCGYRSKPQGELQYLRKLSQRVIFDKTNYAEEKPQTSESTVSFHHYFILIHNVSPCQLLFCHCWSKMNEIKTEERKKKSKKIIVQKVHVSLCTSSLLYFTITA